MQQDLWNNLRSDDAFENVLCVLKLNRTFYMYIKYSVYKLVMSK